MVVTNAENGARIVGLFLLKLQSNSAMPGAPALTLELSVDTPHRKATGHATVTQALAQPIVCQSHVAGPLIYETVMPPGKSAVRFDLVGYPNIHWPLDGGVGPVMPMNFRAMVVLSTDFSSGIVQYEYLNSAGQWVATEQTIEIVKPTQNSLSAADNGQKGIAAHTSGISLSGDFENLMKVGGELAWFVRDINASTGYSWSFRPDNSGVYRLVEVTTLHPSVAAVGAPGKQIWKFEAVRQGEGTAVFELNPPGGDKASEAVKVRIKVS